jgi:DNA-directed RNA polymerase specialized sigma24 family protein
MRNLPPLTDSRILRPSQTALALDWVSEMELLRLKTLARWYARGLPPDVGWEDLLQEAITRVLTAARQRPEDVAMVAFIGGIMRSLRAEHWRRFTKGHSSDAMLRLDQDCAEGELLDPAPGPERTVCARQELAAIRRLFTEDSVALEIIAGLSEGHLPEQIRTANGISKIEYDSARRRMRRTLLREGLTCAPK